MKNSIFIKKILAVSVNIFAFLLFCSSLNGTAQQTINGTITHDGLEREYILYVPENYTGNKKVPLLFNFHGYTSNAADQMFYGDFRPIADTEGFIIVHPMGLLDNNGITHFNVGWGNSDIDDVGFTDALIDELSANYKIDPKRTYSTGFSNGGFMSYKLACDLSDRFAAVASVGGTRTSFQPCDASHQIPIMEIHGTADATVPYDGIPNFFDPIETLLDFWIDFNNCNYAADITNIEDINPDDGSTVEYQVYPYGDNGARVEHYKIIDGGHTWPGSVFAIPDRVTNYDINASEEIWKFLSGYDINGEINTHDGNGNLKFTVYPNPADTFFNIYSENYSKPTPYKLISLRSKVVAEGNVMSSVQYVDVSHISKGIYFLIIGKKSYPIFIY